VRLFDSDRVGVKICGITNEADALLCVEEGADALGFNFFPGSKRFIDFEESVEWIRRLEGRIDRVAVVVNADEALLARLRESGCFDLIQYHGEETPLDCEASGFRQWMRAVRAKNRETLEAALKYKTSHLLLDAWSPLAFGGTGEKADWAMIRSFSSMHPSRQFVLAGGLTPENVADAIRVVVPAAVDVAGGVESGPRKKDRDLVRRFIQEARRALFSAAS